MFEKIKEKLGKLHGGKQNEVLDYRQKLEQDAEKKLKDYNVSLDLGELSGKESVNGGGKVSVLLENKSNGQKASIEFLGTSPDNKMAKLGMRRDCGKLNTKISFGDEQSKSYTFISDGPVYLSNKIYKGDLPSGQAALLYMMAAKVACKELKSMENQYIAENKMREQASLSAARP